MIEAGKSHKARVFRFSYEGRVYAIKKIGDMYHLPHFEREAAIGPLLSHPNIVTVLGRGEGKWRKILVMDYVGDTELNDDCQRAYFSITGLNNVKLLAQQIRGALAYLHENRYIYRDIKGENIRVQFKRGKLTKGVLVDLGMVRHTDTNDGLPPNLDLNVPRVRSYSFSGNGVSVSPEVLKNEDYTTKIDCWGFGALLLYLITDKYPFEELTKREFMQKISTEDVPLPEWLPATAKDLIGKLLDRDPEKRPSLQEIEGHSFFS